MVRTNDAEVGAGFVPRLDSSGYCEGVKMPISWVQSQQFCCGINPNGGDISQGIVTAVAICLYPPGKVPPEQPQPTF